MARTLLAALIVLTVAAGSSPATGQSNLADYYGFDGLEITKIGRAPGPVDLADMNLDGLLDIVVVNNHASRIEIHYQKRDASPDDLDTSRLKINEFPEHWRYRRENVSVAHRVSAFLAHDFDDDGLMDIIYSGIPAELVFMRQTEPGVFELARRHRVKSLAATRTAFGLANVVGDDGMELLAIVDGEIAIWPLDGASLGTRTTLSAGDDLVAFMLEDYDGDGRTDIAGVVPDDAAPVRMWLGVDDGQGGASIGPQRRFEMPPLIELDTVRLPGEAAARLAAIERVSKRTVIYSLSAEPMQSAGDREAAVEVFTFTDPGSKQRSTVIIDADGDGDLDLLATDTNANTLVMFEQADGKGITDGESFPGLSDVTYLVAGNVDTDAAAELFILSEEEAVVGRADVDAGDIPFPRPVGVSDGYTPVALNLVDIDGSDRLAVIAKDGRKYVIDLVGMDGTRSTVELGSLSRAPGTIQDLDADQDGHTDLLLFTRDKPMTMLRNTGDGFTLMESKDMGQFGLVKSASADNTAVYDIDRDGKPELLIAADNFVRAVRYDNAPENGASPGWQVVRQINAADPASKLVSIALSDDRIVTADRENQRLVMFGRSEELNAWREIESIRVIGFEFGPIHAGQFTGDGRESILAVGDDGFGIIRLAGNRVVLRETDAWRPDDDDRRHHELASGDVNSDGFTDMISLDAGEQMCEIFTFTETGRLLYATGFQVFESKLFSGGDAREYQPEQVLVGDVTGDGADDLVLLAHDRVLVFPQMVK